MGTPSEKLTQVHEEFAAISRRVVTIESRFKGIAKQEAALANERAILERELIEIHNETHAIGVMARETAEKHE